MIQVYDKYGKIKSSGLPGSGTVTSFSAGDLSPIFTSTVTSPTSTPNISFSKISQAQNLFYASPNGSSGVPTFRALVAADLPAITGYVPTSRTLTINSVTYDLTADRSWTVTASGATWGSITGTLTAQTDLTLYLSTNYFPIPSGTISQYIDGTGALQTFPTIPTVTPSALTKTDDTNITLTLSGTPATALLQAVGIAVGWTGTLADSRIASASNWNSKQAGSTNLTSLSALSYVSTSFVKMTAAGTFALDTNTYLTSAVTSVGATSPLTSSGGNTPTISTSMATNKLIGRYSASTGVMQEVTIGSGLTLTGAGVLNNTATPTTLGYYGAWQDNFTQTAPASNVGYPFIFRTIDLENQVRIVSNGTNLTRITFDNTGIYNLQFSAQIQNTDNAQHDVTIWIRKNGVDVVGSAGLVSVPARKSAGTGNEGHVIAGWNYLLSVVAGEYYEIVWSTSNASSVTVQYYAAGSPPPSTASVIATVTQQSGIMAGTGITAINSLTGAAQTLTTGTTGTDFAISSTGTTHTFNLPTASALNRGALSSADWTTFNNKQNTSTLLFDTLDTGILRNNYFWFIPNGVSPGGAYNFGYSERISSTSFILLLNGVLTRGMLSFNTTAIAGTIASMRQSNALQLQGYECKFTRKIQFNSNVSGQRFFCGISKGNQFAPATNVEPSTLTDIVGVCQLSTSTNMYVVYNDASGTASTIDLGSSYPCNDSQYNYYITIEQTTTSYIVTVERVTVTTGVSISTTSTLSSNIPNYATGVIQLFTFITNNATAAVASYLDGGGIGSFKNQ